MSPTSSSLAARVAAALAECDPARKVEAVQALAGTDSDGAPDLACGCPAAGFPSRPRLVPPGRVPRRGLGSAQGRAAFFHALAHIEFNAINLALDAVCRYPALPPAFYRDWIGVAVEEALHFDLLCAHLRTLGVAYGDFDAHAGLWELALDTAGDVLARMALVPRVMEARGLDVTPAMIERLRAAGDGGGIAILERIYHDEIGHVRLGTQWFRYACAQRGLEADATFLELIRTRMRSRLRGGMNRTARRAAGFSAHELDALEAIRAAP